MDPATWRRKAKLSLRALALKLDTTSASSVLRWESGARAAPIAVAIAYEKLSGGLVTAKDLNRVRRRFLSARDAAAAAAA